MEDTTSPQLEYAGFFRRVMANIIDSLVYLALFQIVIIFLTKSSMISYIAGNLIGAVYYVFCLHSKWQATLGKYIMRVFIQTKSGERPSIGKAVMRLVTASIPVIPASLVTILHPGMPELQQAFESENFIRIQQTMHDHADLVSLLQITSVVMAVMLPIWFLPIAFTKQRTGLHDMICGTRAVKGRP